MCVIWLCVVMLNKLDIAVINLDRRPDRMSYIYKNIPFLFRPFTPSPRIPGLRVHMVGGGSGSGDDATDHRGYYRRFPAIDGNNLSHHYSEFADLLDTVRDTPRVLGEVGCSLSHYSLWRSHAQNPTAEFLLVFEDDVLFTEKSHERIRETVANLTQRGAAAVAGADVVYVGGQWTPDYDIAGPPPYFPFQKTTTESLGQYYRSGSGSGSGSGSLSGLYPRRNLSSAVIQGNRNVWFTPLFRTAGAYLVSQRGAKRLLDAVETDTALFMKTPLDMWLLEMDFRGYINTSDSFPHPFYQAGFEMVREPSHAQNDIHRCDFQNVAIRSAFTG